MSLTVFPIIDMGTSVIDMDTKRYTDTMSDAHGRRLGLAEVGMVVSRVSRAAAGQATRSRALLSRRSKARQCW